MSDTATDKPALRDLGVYHPKRPARMARALVNMLLNGLHDRHAGRVFVVQIGAGDGQGTPGLLERFRKDGWSGLLVEPHPTYFKALEALHAESHRIAVLNLGLSDVAANLPLHALSRAARERHLKAAPNRATLIRDRLLGPGITEADIESLEVPVLRLDMVLQELGLETAQLVVLNAGGHEEQVLRGFALKSLKPSLVLIRTATGTAADAAGIATLEAAGLWAFRIGDWLAGLAPGHLAVPIEELLHFLGRSVDHPEAPE